MDNAGKLDQLIEAQRITNRLLARAEIRAREQENAAYREEVAKLHNVEPGQVLMDSCTYTIVGRPKEGK